MNHKQQLRWLVEMFLTLALGCAFVFILFYLTA